MAVAESELELREAHQRPRLSIVRVERSRFLAEPGDRLLAAYGTERTADPLLASHQIEIVGFDIRCAAALDRFLLGRKQLHLQRVDDRLRDLVLDFEDVSQIAVEAIGPQMLAGRAVDQLGIDPDSVARLA